MTRLAIGLCIAAAIATSALAAAANAASTPAVVPPENSAAAQYTEAVPTAGGDKPTGGGGGAAGHRSPAKVLGAHDAHKLNAQGRSGREVAEVVAATAPETSPAEPQVATEEPATEAKARAHGGANDGSNSVPRARRQRAGSQSIRSKPEPQQVGATALPSGSSGLGEVLAAATGSSSGGQLGALLPLAIAASIAWSLAYLLRQRRRTG